MLIHTERTEAGQVALLRLRNPPVNSLSAASRAELHAAISDALADPHVRALVLAGDGDFFAAAQKSANSILRCRRANRHCGL